MSQNGTMIVDGREIPIEGERNVLELCRKAGIEIPSFCYHSDLSVFGACRLCLVDVKGRGITTSCTLVPTPGMEIKTSTEEIREMRKVGVQLLLASHDMNCPTCPKGDNCKLQNLARRLGVRDVPYHTEPLTLPIDRSSWAVEINPNRCVLCGDCVRACNEIAGVGALDFVFRGAKAAVSPAFGKPLADVECVGCGQCAAVCPTGAIMPRSEVEAVWRDIDDPAKTVVVQIAPAVRVAIGESFGMAPGAVSTGQLVTALRRLGFDQIYDTSFAADMTVIEESTEFLKRIAEGGKLPLMTSCCPAWVQTVERFFPELMDNLSSCRSPQQMFGSVARTALPERLNVKPENLVVVSIMPCTAKKVEARRPEFATEVGPDVNHVLTTRELARMIDERGLIFADLEPGSLDIPFGFKTGAGVIFGSTGGVSEAVLRYVTRLTGGPRGETPEFHAVRGAESVRSATVMVGDTQLKIGIAHGLAKARKLAEEIRDGNPEGYHLIEVMACPGGCVGGGGQPQVLRPEVRDARARGLFEADRTLQLHNAAENHMVKACYDEYLGAPGTGRAHELLHTHYHSRRRQAEEALSLIGSSCEDRLEVRVCVGTSCHLHGSHDLLVQIADWVNTHELTDRVDVGATFCFENCGEAPNARVGDKLIGHCTQEALVEAVEAALAAESAPGT